MCHLGTEIGRVPSPQVRALWFEAQKDPTAFTAKYLPLLIKGRSLPTAQMEWDGKGTCPTCKREPDRPLPMDAGTERVLAAIKKLEEWAKKEGKEGWK